jgi:hypothetical protein
MADNTEMLRELKKMNEFLEKIDWKLWNLHEKYVGKAGAVASTTKPTLATKDVEPVVPTAKYPTIETWE